MIAVEKFFHSTFLLFFTFNFIFFIFLVLNYRTCRIVSLMKLNFVIKPPYHVIWLHMVDVKRFRISLNGVLLAGKFSFQAFFCWISQLLEAAEHSNFERGEVYMLFLRLKAFLFRQLFLHTKYCQNFFIFLSPNTWFSSSCLCTLT